MDQQTTEQLETDRFWTKVNYHNEIDTQCWTWKGATNGRNGWRYGIAYYRGKTTTAHRVAWLLTRADDIPKGHFVCHKCDNPICVRPSHLFIGTQSTNMQDCVKKNRISRIGRSWKTHCSHGHPFDKRNTYIRPDTGKRQCRRCRYERKQHALTHTKEVS